MEMLKAKPQRNSNIELLKIIAMVLIVFAHQMNEYHYSGASGTIDFLGAPPSANPAYWFVSAVGGLGLFADVIFIACSAFFLIESNRISIKKIFFLMATEVFVMCVSLAIKAAVGDSISTKQILEAVFPTFLQINWFVGYYIVFYLLHPLFNYVIRKLDKKGLAIVTAILVFQCNIILFGMGNTPGSMGLKLLCFVAIYYVVAFYKLYGGKLWESKKFNVVMLVVSLIAYIGFRIALNYVGLKYEYVGARIAGYVHINNPIILVFTLAAVNLANRNPRHNKVVNYFSGLSLVLYLVHKNILFTSHVDFLGYFFDTYGAQHFVGGMMCLALIVLAISMALSILYRHTVYYGVMALGGVIEKEMLKLFSDVKAKWQAKKQAKAQPTDAPQDESATSETVENEIQADENKE